MNPCDKHLRGTGVLLGTGDGRVCVSKFGSRAWFGSRGVLTDLSTSQPLGCLQQPPNPNPSRDPRLALSATPSASMPAFHQAARPPAVHQAARPPAAKHRASPLTQPAALFKAPRQRAEPQPFTCQQRTQKNPRPEIKTKGQPKGSRRI
eukprot:87885-Chlamydomonas_euryale.AAC.6